MSQQYSLRWNNHQPNFIAVFAALFNTQTLVDVTISAEGKQIFAHKVILSACSSYFHSIFTENPTPHPIVILKDVTFANLRAMLEFMYYGEVNVTEEQLTQVLDTAKHLKVKGLTEMPDPASVMRTQGPSVDYPMNNDAETQRPSPSTSPSNKRKKRRKSSSDSTCMVNQDQENRDESTQSIDLMPEHADVTLSSVFQQRRREFAHERSQNIQDNFQQNTSEQNLSLDNLSLDNTSTMPGGQWSMLEHTYPRYSNTCVGAGSLPQDPGMYMNNLNQHMDVEMNDYGQGMGIGASPGPSCAAETQIPPEPVPQATPRRRRTTNPQGEENFQRALEAVRFGGIGFCKAARMFGVNNRTLWLEYKKKGYPNNRPSIKNRIKRENTSPPPEYKKEVPTPERQVALICPPHPVPVGFIDSRPIDFPLQGVPHNSQFNILGVNFNSIQ